MSDKIIYVNPGSLVSHPLNRKLYGDEALDKPFIESVRNLGIIEPITIITMPVNGDPSRGAALRNYVISGHRRWLAAKKLGLKRIAARKSDLNPHDPVAVEQFLIEANRQRVKNEEQRGREFMELLRIEKIQAKQRQLASLKRGAKAPVKEIFPERDKGQARDRAAESLGISGRQAEKLLKIIEAADSGSEKARGLLDALNENHGSIDRAFKEIRKS